MSAPLPLIAPLNVSAPVWVIVLAAVTLTLRELESVPAPKSSVPPASVRPPVLAPRFASEVTASEPAPIVVPPV